MSRVVGAYQPLRAIGQGFACETAALTITLDSVPTEIKSSWWPRWGVPILEHLCPILVYAGAAIGISWPAVQRLSTHVSADLGDSLQNTWNIWWINRALGEGSWFYNCALQFHPEGTDLYFHTLSPAATVPAAILVFFGLAPAAAYNVMILLGLTLGGWAHYFLARRLGVSYWPAFVAGAALTFGPFHMAHTSGGHLQLTSIHWLSLYFVALLALFDEPSKRRAALTGLALAMVTFTDWYILLCAGMISIALFLRWSFGEEGFLRKRAVWAGLFLAGVTYLVTAGPLIGWLIYLKLTEDLSPGHSSWFWAGDLQTLFLPNRHMLWSQFIQSWRNWTGNGAEASTYLGLVLIGLGIFAVRDKSRASLVLMITAGFLAILTLGPYLHYGGEIHFGIPMPYLLLERYVPILGLMGCPGRFALGAAFCLSLAAALGLQVLWDMYGFHRFLAVFIGLAALAELAPSPLPSSALPNSSALEAIANEEGDFAVLDTHFGNARLFNQTMHGRPIIIGHTSRYYQRLFRPITEDPVLEQIRNPPGFLEERLQRVDERIFFDWGQDAPAPELPTDHFEVRWQGEILVPFTGFWRFYVDEDDGCRVRIDGRSVIDSWWRHSRRRVPGEIRLRHGWHRIEVDYFDWSGPAVMELRWARGFADPSPVPISAFRVSEDQPGIRGTYYARTERLPEGGRSAALQRLRELGVRYIIKPSWARSSFERSLGLSPRREGRLMIFEVPAAGDEVEPQTPPSRRRSRARRAQEDLGAGELEPGETEDPATESPAPTTAAPGNSAGERDVPEAPEAPSPEAEPSVTE